MSKKSQALVRVEEEDWYKALVRDCKALIVETEFTASWVLIEGYHKLGKRLLSQFDNFKRRKIYGKEITKRVADSIGKSRRTIEYAIRFAKKYPELDQLPEGKNLSWRKICHEYLPDVKQKDKREDCKHLENRITFHKHCEDCKKWWRMEEEEMYQLLKKRLGH